MSKNYHNSRVYIASEIHVLVTSFSREGIFIEPIEKWKVQCKSSVDVLAGVDVSVDEARNDELAVKETSVLIMKSQKYFLNSSLMD